MRATERTTGRRVTGPLASLAAMAGVTLATLLPVQARAEVNLITNPGNDLPLVAGEIPGWVESVGSSWTQRSVDPVPQAGAAYFFAGAVAHGELTQVVDLTGFADWIDGGARTFDLSGYIRSWPQSPSDSARVVVDLLDAGGTVLATQDTGELSNSAEWQALALAVMPPAGTRQARLTLVAQRYNGDNNDGYLDSLVLWPRVTNQQLGGSLAGVVPQAIECRNKTRGTQVGVAVRNNWRCKAGGLVLTTGDTVTQRVSSLASSAFMPLGMEVYGMKVKSVTCDNLTTGQRVTIRDKTPRWDCAAAGLVVAAGDQVVQTVNGRAR